MQTAAAAATPAGSGEAHQAAPPLREGAPSAAAARLDEGVNGLVVAAAVRDCCASHVRQPLRWREVAFTVLKLAAARIFGRDSELTSQASTSCTCAGAAILGGCAKKQILFIQK